MNAIKIVLVTLLAGVLSIGFAVLGERWLGLSESRPPSQPTASGPLAALPEIRLPNVDGEMVTSRGWASHVVVLHYWATSCPICVEQIDMLLAAQRRHVDAPLQIVGIAIDQPADVVDFLAEHPVDYPVLIGDAESIAVARRLGDRLQGLPFTVIFDRFGQRAFAQTGELSPSLLEQHLVDLLAADNAEQQIGK